MFREQRENVCYQANFELYALCRMSFCIKTILPLVISPLTLPDCIPSWRNSYSLGCKSAKSLSMVWPSCRPI